MSKYTTEVRYICENYAGLDDSVGFNDVEQVLNASWNQIFTSFPIYSEDYRATLCKKILRHFYTREIGFETVGLWKLKLNMRMNEIMPYYNQMYSSTLLEYNPLTDYNFTRTINEVGSKAEETSTENNKTSSGEDTLARTSTRSNLTNDSSTESSTDTEAVVDRKDGSLTSSGTNSETLNGTTGKASHTANTNTKVDLFSNTPQGGLTGIDNMTYLTTAEKITDNGSNDTTDNITDSKTTSGQNSKTDTTVDTENKNVNKTGSKTFADEKTFSENRSLQDTKNLSEEINESGSKSSSTDTTKRLVEEIIGKRGTTSYPKLIEEMRKSFLNIDMMIIRDLENLFMLLW